METNINLKNLWAKQKTSLPDTDDLFLKVNQLKKMGLRKMIITNIILVATSAFIIFIWVKYKPQLLSTKIGIVITILAMVVYVFAYNQRSSLFKNTGNTESNRAYLQNLLAIKAKQQFLQKTMLSLYFIMLSCGIGLYMYEPTLKMSSFWAIVTYGITAAWILFNWFYLRPKQIKKQQSKLDGIISKFENIVKQLEE